MVCIASIQTQFFVSVKNWESVHTYDLILRRQPRPIQINFTYIFNFNEFPTTWIDMNIESNQIWISLSFSFAQVFTYFYLKPTYTDHSLAREPRKNLKSFSFLLCMWINETTMGEQKFHVLSLTFVYGNWIKFEWSWTSITVRFYNFWVLFAPPATTNRSICNKTKIDDTDKVGRCFYKHYSHEWKEGIYA